VGPQTRAGWTAKLVYKIDSAADASSIEEAIFQSDIPAIAQWSTNTCKQLPCNACVRIIKIRASKDIRHLGPRNADTNASKTLDSVIVAKVQQTVQHEAERIYFAVDWGCTKKERPATRGGLWDTRR